MSLFQELFVEVGSDCSAVSSATWGYGGHEVTFALYGPSEARIQEELTHRACVDVLVTPAVGQRTIKETELELFLINFMERLIELKEFPRTKISGRLCIIVGDTDHPRTVAASLNAISLTLLQSGLPLRATIAAVCADTQSTPITIAMDITNAVNHEVCETKDGDRIPSIFSVYSGCSTRGIPIPELNALLSMSDSDDGLHRQALDIANVMVAQIACSASVPA